MRRTNNFMTRSHRTYFDRCKWWARTTYNGSVPLSDMVHEPTPTGYFTAKEGADLSGSGMRYVDGNENLGKFRVPFQKVTIMTNDNVEGMSEDDVVLYHGELWIVAEPVVKLPHNRSSQFSVTDERTYIISLKNRGTTVL